ncbi:MAG: penicillin-binding protein 2 [Abditibacteriaceae bacterium]
MKQSPFSLPDERQLLSTGRKRTRVLSVLLLLPAAVLIGKMLLLQHATASSDKILNFEKRTLLPASRGQVLAADGTSMAVTLDEYTVCANPRGVTNKMKMAQLIASAIGGDAQGYFSLLGKTTHPNGTPNYYVRLQQHVDKDHVDRLKALMAPPKGVKETGKEILARKKVWSALSFELTPKREYPLGNFASQLIGLTNPSGNGITGMEQGFNKALAGKDGEIVSQVDAQNRPLPGFVKTWEQPTNGESLVTTIDPVIQAAADEALNKLVKKFQPKFATAVVLRPKTGEIVALASAPSFDLNHRPSNVIDLATNRCINFTYEPGSTFKMITAAAAVEKVPDWSTHTFFCAGAQMIGHHLIHCWVWDTPKHEHGTETLSDGIRDSCNLTMYGFAKLMGAPTMLEYAKKFGVGGPVDLPNLQAQPGYVTSTNPANWSPEQLANFSFGQGMMLSPYQVTRMASIIANDGVMMKPLLVKGILNSSGQMIKRFQPEVERRVVAPATAKAVTSMLVRVVNEGTGGTAAVHGYQVAGKTGSAQVADGVHGYAGGKMDLSFVGFLPANHPEFAILVLAVEPKNGRYGSQVCAPTFREIAEKAMVRLRLQEGSKAPAPNPALMHPKDTEAE